MRRVSFRAVKTAAPENIALKNSERNVKTVAGVAALADECAHAQAFGELYSSGLRVMLILAML